MSEPARRAGWLPAAPLALGTAVLLVLFFGLPPEVALHFDAKGFVDHVGARAQLLTLPIMAVVIDLVMYVRATVTLSTPETMRLPVALTESNRDRVLDLYLRWTTTLRWLVNAMLGTVMVLQAISARIERPLFGAAWVVPWVIVVVVVSVGYLRAMKRA